jgi:hypothetical protein
MADRAFLFSVRALESDAAGSNPIHALIGEIAPGGRCLSNRGDKISNAAIRDSVLGPPAIHRCPPGISRSGGTPSISTT